MEIDTFIKLARAAIETAVLISMPILGLGLIAGLAVSIFQAATQINDSALAFLPKIGAAIIGIILFGHFMITRMAAFTSWVFGQIPSTMP
jgi:flagellar biosynthetic protein FliQ